MIIPAKTLIIGHSAITDQLAQWFQAHGFQKRWIVPPQLHPLLAARNTGIKQALEISKTLDFDHVVFCDSDVYPAGKATEEWLTLDADLTSARCETDNPGAYGGDEAFHWALSSVRLDVLKKLTAPWVTAEYNADGTQLVGCDCMTFAKKCKAVGATIAHAGLCVHLHKGSWHTRTY